MREGRASTTAMFVAWARGLGTAVSPPDRFAADVLPEPLRSPLRAMQRFRTATAPLHWLARAATVGLVDHINLRTAAIDSALKRAVDEGIDRLVVLGAGLDGRAWRLPWLAGVDVVEIDHPDTQAIKREHARQLRSVARSIEFLAVDFEGELLGERLDAHGLDRRRPAVWIWEGVTPYLEPMAIEGTLRAVAQRSAAGSVLAMTYATPSVTPVSVPGLRRVIGFGFASLGEPLRGLSTPAQMAGRLREVGFAVERDTDQVDWAAGRRLEPTLAFPYRAERLVVARKR